MLSSPLHCVFVHAVGRDMDGVRQMGGPVFVVAAVCVALCCAWYLSMSCPHLLHYLLMSAVMECL